MNEAGYFKLPANFGFLSHRDRIMAKRKLYGANRDTRRPFGLIEFFSTADRRRAWLPHQGIKECAKRARLFRHAA